jgi:hypothetical protein
LSQVDLSDKFLDLATSGGSDIDFASEIDGLALLRLGSLEACHLSCLHEETMAPIYPLLLKLLF